MTRPTLETLEVQYFSRRGCSIHGEAVLVTPVERVGAFQVRMGRSFPVLILFFGKRAGE